MVSNGAEEWYDTSPNELRHDVTKKASLIEETFQQLKDYEWCSSMPITISHSSITFAEVASNIRGIGCKEL